MYEVVVGIDFGSWGTGYAYSFKGLHRSETCHWNFLWFKTQKSQNQSRRYKLAENLDF